jgi:hypothetical protein
MAKMVAIILLLVMTEGLLAITTVTFFTGVPLASLYGAFQGAVFYLVLAMGLGALFKSEITAVLVALVLFVSNGALSGFGDAPSRLSPLFNPLAVRNTSASEILAWTVQNRIGVALAIIALAVLAFARAEHREKLLGS